ncbi:uncharacterized protein LOC111350629 isoform X2 [Spodoptera litura]|uniref:Uncharacterized protein LOC111350629 isoform X2 n=1 Tax=Spodoptera litura TaxID=69820 RepID=A0A9J7DWR0_SPOLT|nr:uncharacterized protein LOC111350629 isoform X2 [Spodoptera litura]
MCACHFPYCTSRTRGYDNDGDYRSGRNSNGSIVGENDDSRRSGSARRDRRYDRRYHNTDAFDPPPDACAASYCGSLKLAICKSIEDACTFWRRLRNDRFHWELFKSVLWFTIGLKLFNDITRHINNQRKRRCKPKPKKC